MGTEVSGYRKTKSDINLLGNGFIWLRRTMARCPVYQKLSCDKKKRIFGKGQKVREDGSGRWAYPRECRKGCALFLAGRCTVYMKMKGMEDETELGYPYREGKESGWDNLQWSERFLDYSRVDSIPARGQ